MKRKFVLFLILAILAMGQTAFALESSLTFVLESPKVTDPWAAADDLDQDGEGRFIITLQQPQGLAFSSLDSPELRGLLASRVAALRARTISGLSLVSDSDITARFTYMPGFAVRATPEQLREILQSPDVAQVTVDRVFKPNLAQGLELIHAAGPRAEYGGAGTAIAVLDTGVDYTHPALGGGGFPNAKVIGGRDTGEDDDDPLDGNGHGTACASIAAGLGVSEGDYVGGVAPQAAIYALKVTSTPEGDSAYTSDTIEAIEWCVAHQYDDPARPILAATYSFGSGMFDSACDEDHGPLAQALETLTAAGIAFFASSGNQGYCNAIQSPACLSDAISVGAVYDAAMEDDLGWCVAEESCLAQPDGSCASTGFVAWDEGAGPDVVPAYSNSAAILDLLAPSDNVSAPWAGGGYTTDFGGTSAAAPYAAGAALLLQSAAIRAGAPALSPGKIRQLLRGSGDPVADAKSLIITPRVNVERAAEELFTCTYNLEPAAALVPSGASTVTVKVSLADGVGDCLWTAESHSDWIAIKSGATGSGAGSVALAVAAHPGGPYRQGLATIAGRAFTVTQAGDGPVVMVPGDYPSIQGAIDAAGDGDTVLVADGAYAGNILFGGKAVALVSEHGPLFATIDAGGAGWGLGFVDSEGAGTLAAGFTVTGADTSGIWAAEGSPRLYNCTIRGNTAEYGGGLFAGLGTSPVLERLVISANKASGDGGGVYGDLYSTLTISDCEISGNSALGAGGGVHLSDTGLVSGTRIANNSAKKGGGLFDLGSTAIEGCLVQGNSAEVSGGGVQTIGGSLTNTLVTNNSAESGGGIFSHGATLTNTTVADNHAASTDGMGGGGLGGPAIQDTPCQLVNSILWGNTPDAVAEGLYVTANHSIIAGGFAGEGNLDQDPMFAGGGDYALSAGSPAIDAGTGQTAPAVDIQGQARPWGPAPDMGAYEFHPDTTALTGYWWNPDQSGSGFSMQVNDRAAYFIWYHYDAEGRATWLVSMANHVGGLTYSGRVFRTSDGYPPDAAPGAVVSEDVGQARVVFGLDKTATVTWEIDGKSGEEHLVYYQLGAETGGDNGMAGCWWDPAYNGTGFFIQAVNDTLSVFWYNYRDDGSPRWWSMVSSLGGFPAGTASFTGDLVEVSGGQGLGGPYVAPTSSSLAGQATMTIEDAETILIEYGSTTYTLEPLRF